MGLQLVVLYQKVVPGAMEVDSSGFSNARCSSSKAMANDHFQMLDLSVCASVSDPSAGIYVPLKIVGCA